MAHQNGTLNFLIHDANGKPQVIKVHTQGKQQVMVTGNKATGSQTIRTVIRPNNSNGNSPQAIIGSSQSSTMVSGAQIIRAVSIQGTKPINQRNQLITFPVQQQIEMKVIQDSNLQKGNFISPILDHTGARKRTKDIESEFTPDCKKRKTEKIGKGLRHFSMKVCEKVKRKGKTSYNEVADELVAEFSRPNNDQVNMDQQYDQKNIRRRVYDALNVLMAMNIISKEKKEIKWLGLPTNSAQECTNLIKQRNELAQSIKLKTQRLRDLLLRQISFKRLVKRNYEDEKMSGAPTPNAAIQLPFIIVNTSKQTVIDCSISNDKTEYMFAFNDQFEIHDDIEVLKRMGLVLGLDKGACSEEDLAQIKALVPKSLEKYVTQMANREPLLNLKYEFDEDIDFVSIMEEVSEDNKIVELNLNGDTNISLPYQDTESSQQEPFSPSIQSVQDLSEVETDNSSDVEVN